MTSVRSVWRGVFVLTVGLLLTACNDAPDPTRAQLLSLSGASPTAPPDADPPTNLSTASPTARLSPTATPTVAAPIYPKPPASPGDTDETPTALATPTLTPVPRPDLRRLTGGGCCTQPFWSADSRRVLFIDRPVSRSAGVYGVDVESSGPPTLVTEQIHPTSSDGQFFIYPDGNAAVVQRVDTGEQTLIPNGGRPVSVSPDGQRVLWQVIGRQGDFDRRRSETWVADLDGGNPRVVARTVGLGGSQWIDDWRILLVGLPEEDSPFVTIAALTLGRDGADDELRELTHVSRPRGMLLSPNGEWLLYFLTFQADSSHDGLWVVPTDGSAPPRKLDFFGSYRWRDEMRLLYVPLEPGVESHALWEYDVVTQKSRRLTDPALTPFKIANNDWAVSPDGRYVVLVGAVDHNLWLVDLGQTD